MGKSKDSIKQQIKIFQKRTNQNIPKKNKSKDSKEGQFDRSHWETIQIIYVQLRKSIIFNLNI